MRLRIALLLPMLPFFVSCDFPDFNGRSREIQTMAFGNEIVGRGRMIGAHMTPDQRNTTWLYNLRPELREQLAGSCIRDVEATHPYRAFKADSRRTTPGCVIWEGRDGNSDLAILISDETIELREIVRPEGDHNE